MKRLYLAVFHADTIFFKGGKAVAPLPQPLNYPGQRLHGGLISFGVVQQDDQIFSQQPVGLFEDVLYQPRSGGDCSR